MRDIRRRVIIAFATTILIALISAVCVYFTMEYALTIVITEKYTARFICAVIDLFIILILYIVICSLRNLYGIIQAIRGSDFYTITISCVTKDYTKYISIYKVYGNIASNTVELIFFPLFRHSKLSKNKEVLVAKYKNKFYIVR